MKVTRSYKTLVTAMAMLGIFLASPVASAAAKKPNILVIMADDIGYWNLSHINHGMMGYKTPNIDRIANEGLHFTDYYAEQSCTAGRAAFITGQIPVRTGLTKVGMPGAKQGLQKEDPTLAELLNTDEASGGYSHHAIATFKEDIRGELDFDVSLIWDRLSNPAEDASGNVPEADDFRLTIGLSYTC